MKDVMTSQKPETIIWDLDGTTIDSLGILVEGLGEILPEYGIVPPTHEHMAKHFHGTLEESIGNAIESVDPQALKTIVDKFLVIQDTYYELIDHHIFPDTLDLMSRYHDAGSQQIILTNRAHEGRLRASPRHIVQHSQLSRYIDAVVCGDDGSFRKPDPRVLDSLRAGGEISLENLKAIGDQFVDAQFAQNIGAVAILVARHGSIQHLDQLAEGWQDRTQVVGSLFEVEIA